MRTLELLLNRRWILKSRERELYYLPVIEPSVRDMFLLWLSKALERKNHCAKTEDGQMYYIEQADVKEYCMLKCTDGTFQMPAYTIVFEDGESK